MSWRHRAACIGMDINMFYPEPHQGRASYAACLPALDACRGCEVRAECLADALATRDTHGVRGGQTPAQLRELLRRRRVT